MGKISIADMRNKMKDLKAKAKGATDEPAAADGRKNEDFGSEMKDVTTSTEEEKKMLQAKESDIA